MHAEPRPAPWFEPAIPPIANHASPLFTVDICRLPKISALDLRLVVYLLQKGSSWHRKMWLLGR